MYKAKARPLRPYRRPARRPARRPVHRRKRSNKRLILPFLMLILLGLFVFVDQAIAPTLNDIARQKTHLEVVDSMERGVRDTMAEFPEYVDYQQLIYVEKNQDGQVSLLIPNTMRLNTLVAEIVLKVEDNLKELQMQELSIPLGAASGSKILASWGPNIGIDIWPISTLNATISDDFVEQGLNQTRHRIWLELSADYSIAVPFDKEKTTVTTQVLLTEGIIVGPIPQTYFDFSF